MDKKFTVIFLLVFLCILIGFVVCVLPGMLDARSLRIKQNTLADQLGVSISDYPYPTWFPGGYFSSVLNTEMDYENVHKIVQGYRRAYVCFGYEELYYYFYDDEDEALRIWIRYGDSGFYEDIYGEDTDSRMLFINDQYLDENCQKGVLEKSPRRNDQEAIASKLGITIESFPNEEMFPFAYYDSILKPGMTVADTHIIIKGYDKAYDCLATESAEYYYFRFGPRLIVNFNTEGMYLDLVVDTEGLQDHIDQGCKFFYDP